VEVWDLADPQAQPRLLRGRPGESVGDVAFSPDGQWLAATRIDLGIVELWNMADLTAPPRVLPHEAAFSVAFSPDGQTLASGSMYTTIKFWNYRQPAPVATTIPAPGSLAP
jgi:WD40 repeat protein